MKAAQGVRCWGWLGAGWLLTLCAVGSGRVPPSCRVQPLGARVGGGSGGS